MRGQDQQVAEAAIVEDGRWLGELHEELRARLAPVFCQARSRLAAFAYIGALLTAPGERRSCWQLAEQAGLATPRRMQALLAEHQWEWREAPAGLQRFILARLADPEAVHYPIGHAAGTLGSCHPSAPVNHDRVPRVAFVALFAVPADCEVAMITPRTVRSICRRGRWLFLPVAGSLVLTGTLAAAAQPTAGQPVMGIPGFLSRVSAVSASDAWAVGSTGTSDQPLIVHWNGTHWSQVTSPNVPTGALSGVSMVSVTDGWAVGTQFLGETALIEHWNGTNWALVPPPHISGFGSSLRGVSMVSATDGWAVGYYDTSNEVHRPLVLHWNGTRWAQVPISVSSGYTVLFAVSAASKSDAWAVGTQLSSTGWTALTLHWNGTSWTQVPSPNPSPAAAYGVSDASPGNAWTVGRSGKTSTVELPKTLSMHWSGTAWQHVFSPNPGPPNALTGVAILSTSNAWSVGDYNTSTGGFAALTLHWNGTNWARVPNQGGTTDSFLTDVTMVSATDGWAVGGHSSPGKVLILHWNGTTWSRS